MVYSDLRVSSQVGGGKRYHLQMLLVAICLSKGRGDTPHTALQLRGMNTLVRLCWECSTVGMYVPLLVFDTFQCTHTDLDF